MNSSSAFRLVMLTALINGLAWSVVVPPFQGPDDHGHFAYIQYLAEIGDLPGANGHPIVSVEQLEAMEAVKYEDTRRRSDRHPPWNVSDYRAWLKADSQTAFDRANGGGESFASPNPPLFYLYQAGSYGLSGGDIFNRLAWARLFSVLLFLVTVGLVWATVAKLFSTPLAARMFAALAVSLLPMVAYILTSIHPDALLTAIVSGMVYCGILLIKHGPRVVPVLSLCLLFAAAATTKLVGPAFFPATIFVIVYAMVKYRRTVKKSTLVALSTISALLLASPFVITALVNSSGTRESSSKLVSSAAGSDGTTIFGFLSYLAQWYVPKAPFVDPVPLTTGWPLYDRFVSGSWGQFGPVLDLRYAGWIYPLLAVLTLLIVTVTVALAVRYRIWRGHCRPYLIFFILLIVPLWLIVHYVSYKAAVHRQDFFQARYFFPLISLPAVALAFIYSSLADRYRSIFAYTVFFSVYLLDMAALAMQLHRYYGLHGLATLADSFHRASLFGFSWEGAWLYWLLMLGLLAIAPVSLFLLNRAEND